MQNTEDGIKSAVCFSVTIFMWDLGIDSYTISHFPERSVEEDWNHRLIGVL
jgi:hypothetical protein